MTHKKPIRVTLSYDPSIVGLGGAPAKPYRITKIVNDVCVPLISSPTKPEHVVRVGDYVTEVQAGKWIEDYNDIDIVTVPVT